MFIAVHLEVEGRGLDHPDSLLAPAGRDHFFDEVEFNIVEGLEALEIALEHGVEVRFGFVGEHERIGEEAVTECVHGGK